MTGEIYAIDPLGNSEVNLTNSPAARDADPAWSPDGSKIAWNRDNNIWVMNADGSNPVSLTSGLAAWAPHWSPDGQWLSFTGVTSTSLHDSIFLLSAAGGTPLDLINDPTLECFDEAWSPSGDEITFVAAPVSGTFKTDIYKLNIHTLVQTRLTTVGDAGPVTWSPDGAHIAYFRPSGLYVMDPDGGNLRNLSTTMQLSPWIAWSPDSRRIAGQSGSSINDIEIYVIDVMTGDIKRLTYNAVYDSEPVWRPDTWK
jgi:Tol biopolymer transport system component